MVNQTLSFVCLWFAVAGQSFGQGNPQPPKTSPPPPKIDVRGVKQQAELRHFSGLDSRIAYEIRARIRGSMIEVIGLFGPMVSEKLQLDAQQKKELAQALEARKLARDEALQQWYVALRQRKEITQQMVDDAVADIVAKELKLEEAFGLKLSSILDPTQCDTLARAAMGDLRAEFARVPFIMAQLDLTSKQVSMYEKCRMANEQVHKREQEFVQSSGKKTSSELDPNQKREFVKLQTELEQNLSRLTIEADNALTSDQFLFVARSMGFVKVDETLEEYFWKQETQVQDDLVSKLIHFRKIKESKR